MIIGRHFRRRHGRAIHAVQIILPGALREFGSEFKRVRIETLEHTRRFDDAPVIFRRDGGLPIMAKQRLKDPSPRVGSMRGEHALAAAGKNAVDVKIEMVFLALPSFGDLFGAETVGKPVHPDLRTRHAKRRPRFRDWDSFGARLFRRRRGFRHRAGQRIKSRHG